MKIIIKNSKNEYIETLYLEDIANLRKNFIKFNISKEPLKADLFAINEKLNSHQLKNLKFKLKELNIIKLFIYSNERETVLTGQSLRINSTFVSEQELKNIFFSSSLKNENVLHKGTIRSGDRISSNGDLVIIGDVNPGALISAKKNVYVWGKLLGIALAGGGGYKNSSISSLYLNPLQLRINNVVAIGPKGKPKSFYPEVAVLEKGAIIIKPLIIEP